MRTLALTALLLACAPAYAQIYKCVDARGVTHYSDKPMPPSCKGGVAKIRATPSPSGASRPSVPPAAGTAAETNRRCTRTMQEYARTQPRDGKPDDSRDQRLEELREQMRGCA
jgi:hypothetical protein